MPRGGERNRTKMNKKNIHKKVVEHSEPTPSSVLEVPKVWKTSITKTELAELPAETFKGKIKVIDSENGLDEALGILSNSRLIGFDTETKPTFKRGERHTVALIQLSTLEESFLFRINKLGVPDGLISILEDENIIKIGLSIHDDFINLHKICNVEPRGFIDLQNYVKEYKIDDNSLSRIYGILFDKRISKGQRLSNWEAPELTKHQQEYAALDATACITIYQHLTTVGFDYSKSKYYREFDDPVALQQASQAKN